jgi:hypothetical protein
MTARGDERAEGSRGRARALRTRFDRLLAGGAVAVVSAAVTVTVPDGTTPDAAGAARTYSADLRLAGVTLGVGGTSDGFSATLPFYFYGTAIPQGDRYQPIVYPASFPLPNIPIISTLPVLSDLPYWSQSMAQSSTKGAATLQRHLDAVPAGEKVTVLGLSQGALVAEMVRAAMANDPDYVANAQDYKFVLVGNPTRPDGGLLTRFGFLKDVAALDFLGIPFGRPGPSDSPFKTTDIVNQYDGISDFPRYFNPLAIANAAVGMVVQHVIPGYVFDDPNDPNRVETTVGNTTYITLPKHLPLLFPLRALAALIGAERFVDFMEPVLRVFVEMGYERTADPSKVAPFSFTTPQAKIKEAMAQLPGAIAESLAILGGKPYTPTMPQPVISPDQAPDSASVARQLVAVDPAAQVDATSAATEEPTTTVDDAAAVDPVADAATDTKIEHGSEIPKVTGVWKRWTSPHVLASKPNAVEQEESETEQSTVEGTSATPSTDTKGSAGSNESADTRGSRSGSHSKPDTLSAHGSRTDNDRKASRPGSDAAGSDSSKESKPAA